MRKLYLLSGLLISFCTFMACSDNKDGLEPPPAPDPVPGMLCFIDGYAELGAFRHNSKVAFYPLDKELARPDEPACTDELSSDMGAYELSERMILQNVFFEVEVTGTFFNGVKNDYSESQVTMRAINHVGTPFERMRSINHYNELPPTNINILTQLTSARILTLIKKNIDNKAEESSLEIFQKASKQAMDELMMAFSIKDYHPDIPSHISFLNFNQDAGMMAAISAIILESVGEEFLNNFFNEWDKDFAENGRIDNDVILETISNGQQEVESVRVQENLQTFYMNYKENISFPPFWQFIDRNGDGVIDENDKPESSEITPGELVLSEEQCIILLEKINKHFDRYLQTESVWEANICGLIGPIPGYPTTLAPERREVYEIWETAYSTIRQCNLLIHLLTTKEHTYDIKPYIGTAYTIQSQIYLSLTQLFGDVPYMTPENFNNMDYISRITRSPVKTIYTQLLEVLKNYSTALPSANEQHAYLVSSEALQLLMAGMCAETGEYAEAGKYLDSMEGNYLSDFIWKVDNNKNLAENRPLYEKYMSSAYHVIYSTGVRHLLKAEICLASNKVAEASEALKHINTDWEGSNDATKVKMCLVASAEKLMGKRFGYFALLKRMGIAKERLRIEEFQLLLPIPLREIDSNPNIKQNPGYK